MRVQLCSQSELHVSIIYSKLLIALMHAKVDSLQDLMEKNKSYPEKNLKDFNL